ncbi:hypothetical protein [Gorillibacterium timonense]|uniref:hypothetical protein n=1 Tax=Gorillibacterium timonense TaxID=1689269 RepID=UPI00071CD600|nr:hypothetical protein [Gorillibacterium timonense]
MGVKFAREYEEIVEELTDALLEVQGSYEFLDMTDEDWEALAESERRECIRTLADDVFYGLGTEPDLELGNGKVAYDARKHWIQVADGDKVTRIIRLI